MMESVYSDIKNPAELASVEELYKEIKKSGDVVTKIDVEKFLSSEDSYTLHRYGRNRFSKRKFNLRQPSHILLGYVAYTKFCETGNVPYLLFLMDGGSCYLTKFKSQRLWMIFIQVFYSHSQFSQMNTLSLQVH